jgi:hypothetical protein
MLEPQKNSAQGQQGWIGGVQKIDESVNGFIWVHSTKANAQVTQSVRILLLHSHMSCACVLREKQL